MSNIVFFFPNIFTHVQDICVYETCISMPIMNIFAVIFFLYFFTSLELSLESSFIHIHKC